MIEDADNFPAVNIKTSHYESQRLSYHKIILKNINDYIAGLLCNCEVISQ